MKKILCAIAIMCSSHVYASDVFDLQSENGTKMFLTHCGEQNTKWGDSFDLSQEDAKDAMNNSNNILHWGVSHYVLSDDFQNKISAKEKQDVVDVAKQISDQLKEGTLLEAIDWHNLKCKNINSIKQAFSIVINHFCWDEEENVTTEVIGMDVAAIMVARQRMIQYKKTIV